MPSARVALPGIIGGLGPAAHIDFQRRLLDESVRRGATRDQHHLEWIAVSAAHTPDRTASLLANDAACAAALTVAAQRLAAGGADFAVSLCLTSHALRAEVERATNLPWLDLIELTCDRVAEHLAPGAVVAVMQTTGTLSQGLFVRSLQRRGFVPRTAVLGSHEQAALMTAIYDPVWGLKATGTRVSPEAEAIVHDHLRVIATDAQAIIPGCTELSLITRREARDAIVVEPLDCAAAALVEIAKGERRAPQEQSTSSVKR